MLKTTLLYSAISVAWLSTMQISHADDVLVLDEVVVSGFGVSDNDTTGAVSYVDKEAIAQSVGGLDSVVRALPGVFSYMDTPQGTINVNVRGMTGLGRVNTMIDGVPQTLFGVTASSEEGGSFHGSAPSSSSFGAAIDANFLVGIEVNRGGQGGAHGVNALMGSANFRTIGVGDVILGDRSVGMLTKYSYGTNRLGHNGMMAIAARSNMAQGQLGAMLAASGANKSTDYKRGDGLLASSNAYVNARIQKPRSYLTKLEYDLGDHHYTLSGRQYHTNIGGRALTNAGYGLDYHYTPESNWLDVRVLASTTKNTQTMNDRAKYFMLEKARSNNRSNYFDINNSSYFTSYIGQKALDIASTYGVSYQRNAYTRKAVAVDEDNYNYTTFAPAGTQKITSIYLDNRISYGPVDWDLAASRVRTEFFGFKPACGADVPCFPKGAAMIGNTHTQTNGKTQLSWRLHDGFAPFVSVARTSRMPNIQEVFFNNEGGGSMNPFLQPEHAKTTEFGFNGAKKHIFNEHDKLTFKAVYFKSKIKDYIFVQSFFLSDNNTLTPNVNQAGSNSFHAKIATNALHDVTSKGYELQGSYDSDYGFATLSYTNSQSDMPINNHSGFEDFGFSGGGLDKLPERYWTLGLGTRLLDKKLEVGASINYYGKHIRLRPDGIDWQTSNYTVQTLPKSPLITHVHARYQLNDRAILRLNVENVFDKSYIHPLNSQNSNFDQYIDDGEYSTTNHARGRTITVGAELRF